MILHRNNSVQNHAVSGSYFVRKLINAGNAANVPIELPTEERKNTKRTRMILFLYQPLKVKMSLFKF